MRPKRVAVVTSAGSWFSPYAKALVAKLRTTGYSARSFSDYEKIPSGCDVVFALSYFRLIPASSLVRHHHTLVVHESALPKGRGWAPLFWQILEGKNSVPVTLFEADASVDGGGVYIRDVIRLDGTELHDEIRRKQADCTFRLCLRYLSAYGRILPKSQRGTPTQYKRRTSNDSELDIDKTIRQLFNQLRVASNTDYPAFFRHKGKKYVLSIRAEGRDE